MRDYIGDFSLDGGVHGNQGYSRVLLQLCGPMASGKSMLINSCKYVLDGGDYIMHASGIETLVRQTYPLTPNITIADNRCFARMNYSEIATAYAQLGAFTPLDERVDRITTYDEMIDIVEETDMAPNYTDLTVPVYVCSARHHYHEDWVEMATFLRGCRTMTGITPIIVITHKNDTSTAQIERRFRLAGAEQVVLLENYTEEDDLRTLGRDTDILKILYTALQDVTYKMSLRRQTARERTERKKIPD